MWSSVGRGSHYAGALASKTWGGRDKGQVTWKVCSCGEDAIELLSWSRWGCLFPLLRKACRQIAKPYMTLDFPHISGGDCCAETVCSWHDHVLILLRTYLSSPLLSSRPNF